MRVLFDGRSLLGKYGGGIPEYTRLLLRHLVETDDEWKYVLFQNSFKGVGKEAFPGVERVVDWHLPNRLVDLSSLFLKLPRVGMFRKYDVFLKPHFHPLWSAKRLPTVLTFHDLWFEKFPEHFSWKKRIWHLSQSARAQAERAERIIAVSEATKKDVQELYGIESKKIQVVHSGINPFFKEHVPLEVVRGFRDEHRLWDPFVLCVGTIEPRKNLVGALRAFEIVKERIPDLEFVVVGSEGWLSKPIVKELKNSKYKESIRLWGKASYEDLRNLYKTASVFLFPSFFEGFGFPPLEAQAAGTPVVASLEGSLREILEDSVLGVDPRDHEEIADALETVLSSEEMRDEYIKRGKKNAERFDWRKTARETKQVLESVV